MSLAEDSRRVALEWIKCATEGRFDDLMALGAPDATWWISGTSPYSGTQPYAERVKQMKELFKEAISVTFTIGGITAEGDTVVLEGMPRAEAKDGRIYVNDIMIKFVVKDGRFQSVREYVDFGPVIKFIGGKAT